ncbi:MAG: hypothetical protein RR891_06200 [Clostridium sp.]
MYKVEMDLRNTNDGKVIKIKEIAGDLELIVDDCVIDVVIKFTDDTWYELFNRVCVQRNEKTYEELMRENMKLKGLA